MTFDEARKAAERLNEEGRWRHDWFYYPAYHDGGSAGKDSPHYGQHFVMRRPKKTPLRVAVFADGSLSVSEKSTNDR